ncbi:DUF4249 domain-containing protein [Mesonia sp. K7]|uniref:DUF4249 domain-containing protein n=1 Tax=Mesonia sp. K7 TaxID=2218606 RepID=UPI000DA9275E|nr:DUF4249 domain-containing protein [Mesonia sp. K7]PZD79126.1 DUF4249 domain-containing protein [Mesonia sp. K7]
MKKTSLVFLFFIAGISISCTDVVTVDVPEAASRLVVEASLDWEFETNGNNQTIRVSQSTPYFTENLYEPVTTAQVKVINEETQEEFVFTHADNGYYFNDTFNPIIDNSYRLEVNNEEHSYRSTETLVEGTKIIEITQSKEEGFDDEIIEINIVFDDKENVENYYLLKCKNQEMGFYNFITISDEYFDGNTISVFYELLEDQDTGVEPFEAGDVAEVELYGISKAYYDYLTLLINQSEASGNPFAAIPAELKGNIVNENPAAEPAFGYFRLTQVDKTTFTIQ